MKFNSQYQWFRQYELNEDYASRCISYKELKKPLSKCRKRDPSIPPPDKFPCQSSHRPVRAYCTACDSQFWPILGKEVQRVSRFFHERAAFLLKEHGLSPLYSVAVGGKEKFCWYRPWKKVVPPPKIETDAELAEQVRQLIDFAHVNSIAVRKLAKKYDKVHRTGGGREFMQRVMRREKGNSFLKDRALLHELTALHSSLKTDNPHDAEIVEELKKHCGALARDGVLCAGEEGDEERLPGPYPLDLNCPLCLEVFYRPMALKCGHVFCRTCACLAAHVHPKNAMGLAGALKTEHCPMCREAGVFNDAIPLPKVGALVKQRFPEEWNEREEEELKMADWDPDK